MALLGAALAPVIHCSNWEIRSIIFSRRNELSIGSDGETFSYAFGYPDARASLRLLQNERFMKIATGRFVFLWPTGRQLPAHQ